MSLHGATTGKRPLGNTPLDHNISRVNNTRRTRRFLRRENDAPTGFIARGGKQKNKTRVQNRHPCAFVNAYVSKNGFGRVFKCRRIQNTVRWSPKSMNSLNARDVSCAYNDIKSTICIRISCRELKYKYRIDSKRFSRFIDRDFVCLRLFRTSMYRMPRGNRPFSK